MAQHGGARPNSGRKPKAEELRVRDTAVEAITEKWGGLKEGFHALLNSKEPSLVKWVFEHAAGKPPDRLEIDQKTTLEDKRIDESKLTDEELRTLADIQSKYRARQA